MNPPSVKAEGGFFFGPVEFEGQNNQVREMTFEQLAATTGSTAQNALKYHDALNAAMALFDISNKNRKAAFLATIKIESSDLSNVEEDLYYKDPARLVKLYPRAFSTVAQATPYARNPKGLSEKLYQGYHGRGLIQLTWLDNYRKAGKDLNRPYVENPNLLLEPTDAALSACWFWNTNGCNAAADKGDMRAVTLIVNGKALMHLAEREAAFKNALKVL